MLQPGHNTRGPLPFEARRMIVSMDEEEKSQAEIISKVKETFKRDIVRQTITNICNKFHETGTVEDRPRSGRPKLFNSQQEEAIILNTKRRRTDSVRMIEEDPILNPNDASGRTINRVLERAHLNSFCYNQANMNLENKNRKTRKTFANIHLGWSQDDWNRVIFTDESDILPTFCGKIKVRKERGENIMLPPHPINRKLTIKVWGAISIYGVGPLVRYTGTMREDDYLGMLRDHMLPFYPEVVITKTRTQDQAMILQDDNATPHRSVSVTGWKELHKINFIHQWPANSPDLSIIENVWSYVQDKLYLISHKLKNAEDTWRETVKIWNHIPQEYIVNLYESLPKRMEQVCKKQGLRI